MPKPLGYLTVGEHDIHDRRHGARDGDVGARQRLDDQRPHLRTKLGAFEVQQLRSVGIEHVDCAHRHRGDERVGQDEVVLEVLPPVAAEDAQRRIGRRHEQGGGRRPARRRRRRGIRLAGAGAARRGKEQHYDQDALDMDAVGQGHRAPLQPVRVYHGLGEARDRMR
jgi:hypothetical protein